MLVDDITEWEAFFLQATDGRDDGDHRASLAADDADFTDRGPAGAGLRPAPSDRGAPANTNSSLTLVLFVFGGVPLSQPRAARRQVLLRPAAIRVLSAQSVAKVLLRSGHPPQASAQSVADLRLISVPIRGESAQSVVNVQGTPHFALRIVWTTRVTFEADHRAHDACLP